MAKFQREQPKAEQPKVEAQPKVEEQPKVIEQPKIDNNVVIVSNSQDAVILAKYKDQIGKAIRTIDGRQF